MTVGRHQQKDYGTGGDPLLVPSSLLVYRRFKVMHGDQLSPMSSVFPYESCLFDEGTKTLSAYCERAVLEMSFSSHISPLLNCSCGFYAHYSPQDDFYAGVIDVQKLAYPTDTFRVFGAVEVSGRVVCGSRGVRAERMKIVAVCPDWEYFNTYYGYIRFDYTRSSGHYKAQFMNATLDAVKRYGARVYEYQDDLVQDYPQPDISQLLKSGER